MRREIRELCHIAEQLPTVLVALRKMNKKDGATHCKQDDEQPRVSTSREQELYSIQVPVPKPQLHITHYRRHSRSFSILQHLSPREDSRLKKPSVFRALALAKHTPCRCYPPLSMQTPTRHTTVATGHFVPCTVIGSDFSPLIIPTEPVCLHPKTAAQTLLCWKKAPLRV